MGSLGTVLIHLLTHLFEKVFDGKLLGSTDVGRGSSVESLEVVFGHLLTCVFGEVVGWTIVRSTNVGRVSP